MLMFYLQIFVHQFEQCRSYLQNLEFNKRFQWTNLTFELAYMEHIPEKVKLKLNITYIFVITYSQNKQT